MEPRVVCIGLATLDAIVRIDRLPMPDERLPATDGALAGGGPAATAAVTLARLGVPVAFAGRVGDDGAGRWVRDGLLAEGVDVRFLTGAGRSPFTAVLLDPGGRRALLPVAGSATDGPVPLDDALLTACLGAAWIHVDQVGAAALSGLRAAGVDTPVSLDGGNPIAALDLAVVTLYAPTETALLDRYPGRTTTDALRLALDEGPRQVVATRGEHGSLGAERHADGTVTIHEAAGVRRGTVVSTLGAGDVFHGALLAALLDGVALPVALRWANTAAALSCRGLDGRSAIPSRQQLLDALPEDIEVPDVAAR